VPNRIDFSANAPVYDIRHGALLPESVARTLTAQLSPGARILDVGAGTGRVSIALARLGFDVIAIEPALGMLRALREKAGALSLGCIAADGSKLPLRGRSAEALVISRMLYLVPDWRTSCAHAQPFLRTTGWPFTSGGTVWPTKNGSVSAKRPERCLKRPEYEIPFTLALERNKKSINTLVNWAFAGGSEWRPVRVQSCPFGFHRQD